MLGLPEGQLRDDHQLVDSAMPLKGRLIYGQTQGGDKTSTEVALAL